MGPGGRFDHQVVDRHLACAGLFRISIQIFAQCKQFVDATATAQVEMRGIAFTVGKPGRDRRADTCVRNVFVSGKDGVSASRGRFDGILSLLGRLRRCRTAGCLGEQSLDVTAHDPAVGSGSCHRGEVEVGVAR